MPAVTTDEITEKYLKKAIAEINELADEIARSGKGERVPVLGSGHPRADVFLLKYRPQPAEVQEGVAFFGRAGQALRKSLDRLTVDPLAVYGTNALKFADGSEEECRPFLTRELLIVQPKLVVVMGEEALAFLNGLELPLANEVAATTGEVQELTGDDRRALRARHRRGARRGAGEDCVLERFQGARALVGRASALLKTPRGAALVALLAVLTRLLRGRGIAAEHDPLVGDRVPRRRADPGDLRDHLARAPALAGEGARPRRSSRSACWPSCARSRASTSWRTSRSSPR